MRRTIIVRACWAAALLTACGAAATETQDTSLCPQTYEFGNYGCSDVAGRVVDRSGAPIRGVQVSARPDDANGDAFGAGVTDSAGRYSLRLTRFSRPLAHPVDTVMVRVRAVLPFTTGVMPADSAVVTALFVPVGERVVVTSVRVLALPWP